MVGTRGLGRQQHADQVDWLHVDGVAVDGRLELCEEHVEPVQARQLAVEASPLLALWTLTTAQPRSLSS